MRPPTGRWTESVGGGSARAPRDPAAEDRPGGCGTGRSGSGRRTPHRPPCPPRSDPPPAPDTGEESRSEGPALPLPAQPAPAARSRRGGAPARPHRIHVYVGFPLRSGPHRGPAAPAPAASGHPPADRRRWRQSPAPPPRPLEEGPGPGAAGRSQGPGPRPARCPEPGAGR